RIAMFTGTVQGCSCVSESCIHRAGRPAASPRPGIRCGTLGRFDFGLESVESLKQEPPMATKPAWKRGDFFLLDAVQFLPASGKLRVWYENHEVGEAPAHILWNGRAGEPDWQRASVDAETRGALLVPRRPS